MAETVRALRPDVIVNAAAYTAVVGRKRTRIGPLAQRDHPWPGGWEAAKLGAWMIHYSTDYVFDGSGEQAHGARPMQPDRSRSTAAPNSKAKH